MQSIVAEPAVAPPKVSFVTTLNFRKTIRLHLDNSTLVYLPMSSLVQCAMKCNEAALKIEFQSFTGSNNNNNIAFTFETSYGYHQLLAAVVSNLCDLS